MVRGRRSLLAALLIVAQVVGCGTPVKQVLDNNRLNSGNFYSNLAKQVDYADPQLHQGEGIATPEPFTIRDNAPVEYWDLPLQEAVITALSNSTVLRDLSGQVLRSPAVVPSIHVPGIVESDPRFGIENALSAFDAQFNTLMFFEKNDRALNNTFFGGGTRLLEQDLLTQQSNITKQAATGTQFIVRHNTDYDSNNAPGNIFPSAWNTNFEAEFRHPLLQGGGVEFNRIAGPTGQLGLFNGVVLARANTDVSLAEFEANVRNMIADVENAYWDLYFSYRDLQTKITARDSSLETWRRIHALYVSEKRGGEADKEAQAREQYYRFQEDVENALTGVLNEGTRTNNGSSGGTFRGSTGVQVAERRLRLIMGLPISDRRMIRPADEPIVTRVAFDWNHVAQEALARRPELRRQRWVIKRREMELFATKNFLMPRLDATGRYRWRGFGDDLLNPDGDTGANRFDNAWNDLTSGDFQEWQLGMEMTVPLGFRRAHSAVRNAQLLLARERAVLNEQERNILHDLSNAVGDLERAFTVTQTSYNRLVAARDQLTAVQSTYDADKAPLDLLLEAQRRLSEAEGRYYRALVEYALALRNVHFEKGTSLEYHDVFLQDDRYSRELRTRRPPATALNYVLSEPPSPPADGAPSLQAQDAIDAVSATPGAAVPPSLDVTPPQPQPPSEPMPRAKNEQLPLILPPPSDVPASPAPLRPVVPPPPVPGERRAEAAPIDDALRAAEALRASYQAEAAPPPASITAPAVRPILRGPPGAVVFPAQLPARPSGTPTTSAGLEISQPIY